MNSLLSGPRAIFAPLALSCRLSAAPKLPRAYGVRYLLCGHTHTTRSVSTSDGIRVLTTAGTARAFDSNGCGFQSLRISPTDVNITYTELPGGGGMPGCLKAPWAPPRAR